MNGQLSEHPFAELIHEIHEKELSGALRLERERAKAIVYFEDGELVYATSNLLNLRLSEYVKRRGIGIDNISSDARLSDFALASSLLSRAALTQATLDQVRTEQVTDVVRVLLLWASGEWNFENRARLTEQVNIKIEMTPLLLEAARRFDMLFAASRISADNEMISVGSTAPDQLHLSATEGFLMSRMDSSMELGQLIMLSGLRDPDARQIIYGLILVGLLERESWPGTSPG
jgi:hypothetical protein